jgi:hypothetical protein
MFKTTSTSTRDPITNTWQTENSGKSFEAQAGKGLLRQLPPENKFETFLRPGD